MTGPAIAARVIQVAAAPAHEGPVWFGDEQVLYYTSPAAHGRAGAPRVSIDCLPLDGLGLRKLAVPVGQDRWRRLVPDANAANGMCADGTGGLLVCEQGGMWSPARISRLDRRTGCRETVVDGFEGFALNSPTDVTRHPDGSIWFTDPRYGWLQGFRPPPALPDGVHRYDPASGGHQIISGDFDKPNGVAFSPDGRTLYIGDSGANHEPGSYDPARPHEIVALPVTGDQVGASLWRYTIWPGFPDGLKTDGRGRIWCTTGAGLRVLSPSGEHLGDVPLPGAVNFTFADDDLLLVTADTAVWAVALDDQP